jgi:hypothetical protein
MRLTGAVILSPAARASKISEVVATSIGRRPTCGLWRTGPDSSPHSARACKGELNGLSRRLGERTAAHYGHHHPYFQDAVAASQSCNRAHIQTGKRKREADKPHVLESAGRSGRIRTCDPLVPNEVRYQAALHSVTCGAVYSGPASGSQGGFAGFFAPPPKTLWAVSGRDIRRGNGLFVSAVPGGWRG